MLDKILGATFFVASLILFYFKLPFFGALSMIAAFGFTLLWFYNSIFRIKK